jgi:hypothetical protein
MSSRHSTSRERERGHVTAVTTAPLRVPLRVPVSSALSRLRAWLLAGVAATGLGLLFAAQVYVAQRSAGRPGEFWVASRIEPQLIPWYVWASLAPLVMRGVSHIAARAFGLLQQTAAYLALAVACTVVHAAVTALALGWWWSFPSAVPTNPGWHLLDVLRTRGVVNLVVFAALAAACLAIRQQRLAQQRTLTAARLETRLAEAELRALRAQLEPHFLFNTLNAISAYVRPAPDVAEAMVARLADVLRVVVDTSRRRETTLRDELALARSYLEIHRVRFGDRLRIAWRVDDAALDLPAPPLVLQPVIENAVRHGVEARPQATLITVTAEVREAMVSVEVRDTPDLSPVATTAGRATPPPSAALPAAGDEGGDGGIGLSNTRARLELLFGDRYDLRLTRSEGGSTSVHLAWPAGGAALPIAR